VTQRGMKRLVYIVGERGRFCHSGDRGQSLEIATREGIESRKARGEGRKREVRGIYVI